jgi:hypothetical protein
MLAEYVQFRRAFEGLRDFLWDPQDSYQKSEALSDLYAQVTKRMSPVHRQDFDGLLSDGVPKLDLRGTRRPLMLRPVEKEHGLLPAVFVHFDSTEEVDKTGKHFLKGVQCGVVVALFKWGDPNGTRREEDVRALGLRCELSHGAGDHDYAHVQFVKTLVRNNDKLLGAPHWLPDTHPAIPLDADPSDAGALIIAVIQSLYGARWVASFNKVFDGFPRKVKEARPRVLGRQRVR